MKLVKEAVVEIMVIRLIVVLEEKVVVKERPQMLVLERIMDLELVVLKVLQFVKQVEFHFH